MAKGSTRAAANTLRAFIHQVEALVRSGRLSEQEAALLIAAANGAIAAIEDAG